LAILRRIGATLTILTFAALAVGGIAFWTGYWKPAMRTAALYSVHGVDVSRHQGAIDWKAVSKDGITFAYLKATEGGDFKDPRFVENWRKTSEAGIVRGAYHFFRLKTPGKAQADHFIATVPRESSALPPAVDLEFEGNTSGPRPSTAAVRGELNEFLKRLRGRYGCEPVLYVSAEFEAAYLKGSAMKRPWIRDTFGAPKRVGANPWLFWQFTDKGRIKGIRGDVDLNVFFGDLDTLKKLTIQYR